MFEAETAGLRTALFTREPKDDEQINVVLSLPWTWCFFEIFPIRRRKKDGRKGQTIHRGQKIHISSVTAVSGTHYIPKACPLGDDPSFWKHLRSKEKRHTKEWLELDLHEDSKRAVEKMVTEGDDTILKSLHHIFIFGKLSPP